MAHRVLASKHSYVPSIWLSYLCLYLAARSTWTACTIIHNYTCSRSRAACFRAWRSLHGCTLTLFHSSIPTLHRCRHPAVSPLHQLQGACEVVQTASSRIVKPEEPSHHHRPPCACPCEFAIL